MSACECPICGLRFSGLKPFDMHQRVRYGATPPVTCVHPSEAGLVERVNGLWGRPADPSDPPPWAR